MDILARILKCFYYNMEPDWELAGIYADHGMSGTQTERRPKFLLMVKDCEDGLIDLILCKSISRFSRNTLDAVSYIRKLKDMGVRIIFEKEASTPEMKFQRC